MFLDVREIRDFSEHSKVAQAADFGPQNNSATF